MSVEPALQSALRDLRSTAAPLQAGAGQSGGETAGARRRRPVARRASLAPKAAKYPKVEGLHKGWPRKSRRKAPRLLRLAEQAVAPIVAGSHNDEYRRADDFDDSASPLLVRRDAEEFARSADTAPTSTSGRAAVGAWRCTIAPAARPAASSTRSWSRPLRPEPWFRSRAGTLTRPASASVAHLHSAIAGLFGQNRNRRAIRQTRDARRRRPSAADADELGVALCHELGCHAGADSAVTKVLADRLTCDAQEALPCCRSHSASGHQPTPANLFRDGRSGEVSLSTLNARAENSAGRPKRA